MNSKNQNYFFLFLSYAIAFLLVVLHRNNSFFWDTVQLASAHANYYFQNQFSSLLLPVDIDSGHIPTFGIYLAFVWKLFGRSLVVSHLAMLPFTLGIVFQIYKLCQKFIPPAFVGLATLLILADPSLMSQMTLVSPDVCLVFFFLFGMNAIFDNKKTWLIIAIFCLFLTSMRGMMISLCLLGLDVFSNINLKNNSRNIFNQLIKRSLLYLPALLLFLTFNAYHYYETGWIGYHKDSPWAACFERVDDAKSFFINMALYGWRVLDFGRFGVWFVCILLAACYKKQLLQSKSIKMWLLFCLGIMIILPLNMLWAKNLLGHRYLIPIYLTFSFFTATILFSDFVNQKLKYALSLFWISCLIGGNFIIYPDKVAKGWDSTLAHLPYYELRHQAIDYLNENKIDFKDVASFFPNTASLDRIDLNHDTRHFETFNRKSNYILYSNIYNIEDQTYDSIMNKNNYIVLKQFENKGIYIKILKKQ